MDFERPDRALCRAELEKYRLEFEKYKEQNLQLNLARGNPSKAQLDLSMKMLDIVNSHSVLDSEDGIDCRNYGGLDGLFEAKAFMAELLGVHPNKVMVFGNSSLQIMFQAINFAMVDGVSGCEPMMFQKDRKWLCPVPGYDRHFNITMKFGFELIPVPMTDEGPDMDVVRSYVEKDPSVKGIWCVPKYSNPGGVVYSQRVCEEFAALEPAAHDFRIFWDNAYCVHGLYPDHEDTIPDIVGLCEKAGHPDLVYEFCSTSKISFPGAGISAVATSVHNQKGFKSFLQYATIGPNKINQLRQVRFFKNLANVKKHMAKHADIMRPKFELVESILEKELGGTGMAEWTKPRGGYFISLNTLPGCAKRVVALAKEAGVTFTNAGATYPYGIDPQDSNIRLAPSFATPEQIEPATEILCTCIHLATYEKLLEK